jgi:hypothetical protein
MVTIKDGLGARQVTAEEAFLFYLRKKAVDGNEEAQERLEEIQAFRRERDPDLSSEGITTILRVIVSPDNPNYALRLLKMAVKLYPFQPHAQIKLEPWLVPLFSNGSRAEALRVSTLSGACVLCVLVRHLMG